MVCLCPLFPGFAGQCAGWKAVGAVIVDDPQPLCPVSPASSGEVLQAVGCGGGSHRQVHTGKARKTRTCVRLGSMSRLVFQKLCMRRRRIANASSRW